MKKILNSKKIGQGLAFILLLFLLWLFMKYSYLMPRPSGEFPPCGTDRFALPWEKRIYFYDNEFQSAICKKLSIFKLGVRGTRADSYVLYDGYTSFKNGSILLPRWHAQNAIKGMFSEGIGYWVDLQVPDWNGFRTKGKILKSPLINNHEK